MLCPKCGSNLRKSRYESIDIHTCDSCGGEALRAEALRAIVRQREQRFPQELSSTLNDRKPAFGVPTQESARAITCPNCRRPMQALNYGGDSGIIIDRCNDCGTTFLEHEELEKIQVIMEQYEDDAPEQIRQIASQLDQTRRETAESISRTFAGSRFAFVNAVINRLLDAA